jgi:hypothetical protein
MVMRPVSFQDGADVGTGLGGVTGGIPVTGHASGGQASDQVNAVGQAGAGGPGTSQKKGTQTSGQIRSESPSPPTPILAAVHPEPPGTTLTDP